MTSVDQNEVAIIGQGSGNEGLPMGQSSVKLSRPKHVMFKPFSWSEFSTEFISEVKNATRSLVFNIPFFHTFFPIQNLAIFLDFR